MKVSVHANGSASLELVPENAIEKAALAEIRKAFDKGRKPTIRPIEGHEGLAVSVELVPEVIVEAQRS